MAEVAQGLAGDRAHRGSEDGFGKGEVRGFEESEEVARGGGAGEGDGVGTGFRLCEELLERGDGVGGNLVAIGFGDGDGGPGDGEGFGKNIAGFGGADEQEGFAGSFGKERGGERFGDVLGRDEVDGESDGVGGAQGGRADDGYFFGKLGDVVELSAAVEGFDGVGAGEEKPVVRAEAGQCGVKSAEGGGGNDLDGGNEDGDRAEGFELSGEVGGLVAASRDEDAFVGESGHPVGIVCLATG